VGAYSEFLCPLPASFPLARITRGFFESPLYHVVFSAALYLTQQPGAVTVSTQTCYQGHVLRPGRHTPVSQAQGQ